MNSSEELPLGIKDLLPSDLYKQDYIKSHMMKVFSHWGYQQVLPPLLESFNSLKKGRPDLVDETFKIIDHDGKILALRPDATLPVIRLASTRLAQQARPLRLCYLAGVFRQKRQANFRRENLNIGIEIIGENNTNTPETNQLECISILMNSLEVLNIQDYKIVLSHAQILSEILQALSLTEHKQTITEYISTGQLSVLFEYLQSNNISPETINKLKNILLNSTGTSQVLSYLSKSSSIKLELEQILALAPVFGEEKFIIDFLQVPNENFYSGLYFKVLNTNTKKILGAGGRYDKFSKESATGFSLYIDSLAQSVDISLPETQETVTNTLSPKSNNTNDILDAIKKQKYS